MKCTDIFASLAGTSSLATKEAILQATADNQVLQEILWFAYSPDKRFFIKDILATGAGSLTIEETHMEWTNLLHSLCSRTITGRTATQAVEKFITKLAPEDSKLFKYIIRKDLRAGIGVQTINKVFPGLISKLKFMKAERYTKGDFYKYGPMYMSLKVDCIRGLLRSGTIYSSGGKVIQGVQHIVKTLPISIDLDMELTIPGKDFNTASGLIRSSKNNPDVLAMVFDTPEQVPFKERYEYLSSIFNNPRQPLYPGWKLLKHILAKDEEDIYNRFDKALNSGYEGLVNKTAGHLYQLKRSKDWLKLKNEDTIDAPIVGFKRGTGKYENTLGAVTIRLDNGVLVDVSGFPDDKKHEIWNNKDKYLNHYIEVDYHERTPDGSLRHPRYKRDRWDKTPEK